MNLHRLAILQSLFVSALVVANIIAAKVVMIWNLVVPAAIIIYPFTFLLTDIIGELYGKKEANRTVWYGLLASVFSMVVIYVGMLLPVAPFMPEKQTAYEMLLGPNRPAMSSVRSMRWQIALADAGPEPPSTSPAWSAQAGTTR